MPLARALLTQEATDWLSCWYLRPLQLHSIHDLRWALLHRFCRGGGQICIDVEPGKVRKSLEN